MTTFRQDSQGIFYMLLELDEVNLMSGFWEKLFQTIIGSLSLNSFVSSGVFRGYHWIFQGRV